MPPTIKWTRYRPHIMQAATVGLVFLAGWLAGGAALAISLGSGVAVAVFGAERITRARWRKLRPPPATTSCLGKARTPVMGRSPAPASLAARQTRFGLTKSPTTDGDSNPDKGSLLGITITAVAGVAWTQWGAAGITGVASEAIRVVGILIGLIILIWCGRWWRPAAGNSDTPSGALPRPRSKPIFSSAGFLVVNALQVVAFAGGARLLASTRHAEYLIAWVATVAGVHFLAFGRLFLSRFYWLGAALITAGVAGLLVGIAGGGPAGIKVTSGLTAAASLFAAGGWSIASMLRVARLTDPAARDAGRESVSRPST